MRKTKLWAGFLDYIGWGNFVGPDETIAKMGSSEFEKQFQEYMKTKEGQEKLLKILQDMANE